MRNLKKIFVSTATAAILIGISAATPSLARSADTDEGIFLDARPGGARMTDMRVIYLAPHDFTGDLSRQEPMRLLPPATDSGSFQEFEVGDGTGWIIPGYGFVPGDGGGPLSRKIAFLDMSFLSQA